MLKLQVFISKSAVFSDREANMIPLNTLQDKVREVCDIFPWYKRLIGGKKADEMGSLQDLPFMTSEILENYYYNQPDDPTLVVYQTSGTSSGRRKSIFYSEEDLRRRMDILVKLYSEFIAGSGCTKALADMGGSTGIVMSNSPTIFARLGLEYESISFELPIERHIEQLQTFKPDLLYTMPSILDHIAYASKNPRAIGIRKMILLGEFTTPKWRGNMARLFGLEPHDILVTYGATELGLIASYSHDLDRYILVDGIFAEGIEPHELGGEFEPLGKNESILSLTSLHRKLFPALRFITYDVVRDFRPVMVNGAERQSFHSIVKRLGRELKHGEKISLYDIEQAVYRHVEDAIIRVKVRNNALTVYIKSKAAIDSMIPTIREEIRDCIPEIGTMIRNRLLDEIEVIGLADDVQQLSGLIKNKKIYYENGESK